MALNDVVFIKGQGGLGRPLPGEDYISGFVFYTATLPTGFSSSDRIKNIFSVQDAEALGITATYSDETKATGTYLFTNFGATGDTVELKVLEYPTANNPTGSVSLGVYTRLSTDTTVTILGASYAAFINSGTATHGYTATASTGTVTITAKAGLGIFLNTGTPLSATIVGTIAGTVTQFSGGAYSKLAQWNYHIKEYFRINPNGNLYVGFYAVPSTYDFTDVQTMQNFANGKIRQFAVYCDGTTYTSGKVQAAQAIATAMATDKKPAQILVTFDFSAASLNAMTDLSTLNSNNVSVVIGQDGLNLGYRLYKATGRSITCLGAVLGAVSLAKVNEDIAWLSKFNLSNGNELEVVAFANGVLFSATTTALLTTLDNSRYIFLMKQVDYAGTFVNDSNCCILESSDYAYIENNRTIDKAIRLLRVAYLPALASPLVLNSDGTLTDTTVAYFESLGNIALDQMVRDTELSAKSVVINPTQNVLATSQLIVAVTLVPVGVARQIKINIKYSTSI